MFSQTLMLQGFSRDQSWFCNTCDSVVAWITSKVFPQDWWQDSRSLPRNRLNFAIPGEKLNLLIVSAQQTRYDTAVCYSTLEKHGSLLMATLTRTQKGWILLASRPVLGSVIQASDHSITLGVRRLSLCIFLEFLFSCNILISSLLFPFSSGIFDHSYLCLESFHVAEICTVHLV